jgi:hypothetical protein
MNNKTVLMAAVLAIATVLAAGLLTVLPSAVQEAQANPCSNNVVTSSEAEADDSGTATSGAASGTLTTNGDQNCDFTGPTEFDED